jgi:hypothetical protein
LVWLVRAVPGFAAALPALAPAGTASSSALAFAGLSSPRRAFWRWACSQTPSSCSSLVTADLCRGQSFPAARYSARAVTLSCHRASSATDRGGRCQSGRTASPSRYAGVSVPAAASLRRRSSQDASVRSAHHRRRGKDIGPSPAPSPRARASGPVLEDLLGGVLWRRLARGRPAGRGPQLRPRPGGSRRLRSVRR